MKHLVFTAIFTALLSAGAAAANPEYPLSDIPAKLLVNANAVKRFEEIRVEVVNLEKSRYYHRFAVTVLNENGDKFANWQGTYDLLQSIVSVDAKLFDATGRKLKSLKQSEITDHPGTTQGTFADGHRIKYHNFYHRVYPYTVEYEVEIRMNETMFYPGWVALDDEHISLQKGKMTISLPDGIDVRYKSFNCPAPGIAQEKSMKTYSWELAELPAVQREYASPNWQETIPIVHVAPAQFSIQGYKGNMSTWQDFGKFVFALKDGRDALPDNIKQTVHQLTDGLTDPYRKIDVLYEFLQKNTRYISIQLGIGGWQPFNAQYVAGNRYGDCKALSNYMYALLKEAGILSHYTLVKAGKGRVFFMEDFPSQQFNHVILSVPLKQDTVWLECTSQSLPTGYLSGFTSDRPALLIDENGGRMVRTPKYAMKDNRQLRKISAAITADGQLNADVNTSYHGREEDDIHSLINNVSKDEIVKHLKEQMDLPDYDVLAFDYKEERSRMPWIKENLKIKAGSYAQVTGKRLFIEPNILTKASNKIPVDTSRNFDIQLAYEYREVDSVEIQIPAGYQTESVPQDIVLESKFGKYAATISVQGEKLFFIRNMEQRSGRFPATAYGEMFDFYNKLYAADRRKVVFVKK